VVGFVTEQQRLELEQIA
jgi:hypothetical protein